MSNISVRSLASIEGGNTSVGVDTLDALTTVLGLEVRLVTPGSTVESEWFSVLGSCSVPERRRILAVAQLLTSPMEA